MTIIFCEDDDVPDILHEPDAIITPLRTPFTGGYAPAVHHIEIENNFTMQLYD